MHDGNKRGKRKRDDCRLQSSYIIEGDERLASQRLTFELLEGIMRRRCAMFHQKSHSPLGLCKIRNYMGVLITRISFLFLSCFTDTSSDVSLRPLQGM